MIHAANAALVLLLLVNLTGVTLVAGRFTESWWLARSAAPLVVVAPFFLEHFAGFGSLHWLWPLTTALSLWLIWFGRRELAAHWRIECVYLAAFSYALAWRYAFPDIGASSEKLTDLTFIANYSSGTRLPPVDRWLPPHRFEMYYALQHYGAALMARIFAMPVGTAYNLSICVLAGSVATAAAGTAWLLTRRRGATILLTAALLAGGTGVAPFIRLITPAPQLWSSIRFMGGALTPEEATRPLGQALVRASHATKDSLDLPVELFSYLIGLGDDHPPLSGYLLLTLALLAIALIESGRALRASYAILAATVPLTIAANAWDLPLELFLAAGWIAYRIAIRKRIEWKPLTLGFGSMLLLLAPFLVHFAPHALALHNTIRLVPRGLHTPLIPGLLIFYPAIAVVALHLICGERSRQSLAFCAIFVALAVASEIFFVDDVYSGKYERFNTVLKWWSWIYSAILLVIGALNLRSPSRVCRFATIAVLVLICGYARELGAAWFGPPKPHASQLDGAAWLRDDPEQRAMLEFLSSRPPAIVLQRISDRGYVPQPALAIFAGDLAFLGWPNHEDIWRGYLPEIDQRFDAVKKFYNGEVPDAARWLSGNRIAYVVWSHDDNQLNSFARVNDEIHGTYRWREFSSTPDLHAGIWCHIGP
ncbi:MAG TPA: DUF2298 domain-containing protein [Bryobacteraceae bacterium]|nr:DUF2298 domain-containing protein [Bryobacteraceae bacterium]